MKQHTNQYEDTDLWLAFMIAGEKKISLALLHKSRSRNLRNLLLRFSTIVRVDTKRSSVGSFVYVFALLHPREKCSNGSRESDRKQHGNNRLCYVSTQSERKYYPHFSLEVSVGSGRRFFVHIANGCVVSP